MLELSVALAPAEQDTVLEAAGASVFLEPIAAQDEDQYRFAIAPQTPS